MKKWIKKFPELTVDEKAELEWLRKMIGPFGPGHFYSPIPDLDQVRHDAANIWQEMPNQIAGIDLNEQGQLELFSQLCELYKEISFPTTKSEPYRYYFENPAFSYSDAVILNCMIRHAQPHRIIEVGSGYSSCVTLDTNEYFFDGHINTTFIEPYPELFYSLMKREDAARIRILPTRLQDVSLEEFELLEKDDILFIDSTHVSKINSDVNHVFFNILPRIRSGVYIHVHDIFYPFEYPPHWVYEGRAWNEDYIMRAFLQYNTAFKIVFFSTYLEYFHEDLFRKYMPLCLKNRGGCLWLQKQ